MTFDNYRIVYRVVLAIGLDLWVSESRGEANEMRDYFATRYTLPVVVVRDFK